LFANSTSDPNYLSITLTVLQLNQALLGLNSRYATVQFEWCGGSESARVLRDRWPL